MYNKKVLSASIIFVITMLLIFGGIFTLDVMANDDEIIGEYPNDGNLPNYVLDLEAYKFEPIEIGTTTENGVTINVGDDGRMFDWESDKAVAYVFVKAGSSGYLYDYTPASFSGFDLHGPLNPNGQYAGLSHITFYFAEVGSLEITKQFLFNDQVISQNDTDANFNFEVTVTGISEGSSYPEGYTLSGLGNETLIFENLVAGMYTIEETSSGNEWEVDLSSQEVTVLPGEVTETTIYNNYVPGSLRVDKEFLFNNQIISPNEVDADFNFEITVTGPLGYSSTKSGLGNDSLFFDNLLGGTYTITETSSGNEWEVDLTSQDASIVSGEETQVTFTNNYIPGQLEVTKEFLFNDQMVDVGDLDADFNFEINVTGPLGYNLTKQGTGNETLVFEDLIAGSYTVQETSSGVEWEVAVGTKDAAVISGQTTEVSFTNNLIPGSLEVTKEFLLPDGQLVNMGDIDADFNFEINVTGPLGYNSTKSGAGNETLLFENLAVGTYTVQETSSGIEWEVAVGSQEATVISGQTTEITFTNNYIPGQLEVTKEFLLPDGQVVYEGEIDADFNFEVTVTGPLGYNLTKQGTGNETLIFEDLIAGIYTIEETSIGAEWLVAIGSQETTVISGAISEVTITNNYIIMGETAWAAHDIGVYRYRDRGNWATYIVYDELENGIADIYAGQNEYVGYAEFIENGNNVEISIHLDGWAFEPNTTNLYVQDYEKEPKGNPSPGRFDYKNTESNYEATISVPLNMYYGIHLNVYETN